MCLPLDQLIQRLTDAWNNHDVDRVAALHDATYEGVDVGAAEPQQGPQAMSQSMRCYLAAFPDLRITWEAFAAEDQHVAISWVAEGTHRGAFMNIPPTGRSVAVRGVSLLTVQGGKIIRGLYVWDVAGLLRRLGLLPDLPEEALPPDILQIEGSSD